MTNTTVGVWLSEDGGIGTPDPSHLYRYVGNDPTNAIDPSGLAAVDSGVSIALGFRKPAAGVPDSWVFSYLLPIHAFVIIDSKGYGRFATSKQQGALKPTDDARVRDNDLNEYPLKDPATVKPGEFYSVSRKVYLNNALYDVDRFKAAVKEYLDRETKNPGKYIVGVRDCYNFVETAIEYGKQRSLRISDPLLRVARPPSEMFLSPVVTETAKRTKSTARSVLCPAFDVLDWLDDRLRR